MNVLLVDDHPLILAALKAMIERLQPGMQVTARASAAELRAALAVDARFDLLLLDLQLGDAVGFDLLEEVHARWPALPVVVISASDRTADVIRAIELGAMGYLPKRLSTEELADALRLVMSGGIFVPELEDDGAQAAGADDGVALLPDDAGISLPPQVCEQLGITPRQVEVLALLLRGQANKDIARQLGVSIDTVKDHVQAVLRALGVNSRTQVVLEVGRLQRQRRLHASEPPPEWEPSVE